MADSFPTNVQEFDADERISFSKLDQKFIAVHDDGNEYEFDADSKRWVLADEETIDDDAHLYGGEASASVTEDGQSRKRKSASRDTSEVSSRVVATKSCDSIC